MFLNAFNLSISQHYYLILACSSLAVGGALHKYILRLQSATIIYNWATTETPADYLGDMANVSGPLQSNWSRICLLQLCATCMAQLKKPLLQRNVKTSPDDNSIEVAIMIVNHACLKY